VVLVELMETVEIQHHLKTPVVVAVDSSQTELETIQWERAAE
jgi:hypothetical protein